MQWRPPKNLNIFQGAVNFQERVTLQVQPVSEDILQKVEKYVQISTKLEKESERQGQLISQLEARLLALDKDRH